MRMHFFHILTAYQSLFWCSIEHYRHRFRTRYKRSTNMSPVKRICVFEHSVMTNFNCACPAIQRGQGSGFCLKVPLDSLLVWAGSGGSGETARMRRLAWTFAARISDKYKIRLTRSICHLLTSILCKEIFFFFFWTKHYSTYPQIVFKSLFSILSGRYSDISKQWYLTNANSNYFGTQQTLQYGTRARQRLRSACIFMLSLLTWRSVLSLASHLAYPSNTLISCSVAWTHLRKN